MRRVANIFKIKKVFLHHCVSGLFVVGFKRKIRPRGTKSGQGWKEDRPNSEGVPLI